MLFCLIVLEWCYRDEKRVYKMARRSETKLKEKENHAELVEKHTFLRNAKCFLDGLQKRNGRPRKDLEGAIVV